MEGGGERSFHVLQPAARMPEQKLLQTLVSSIIIIIIVVARDDTLSVIIIPAMTIATTVYHGYHVFH